MGILALLFVLALVFGGVGLLIEGLFWLAIIGLVLVVAGAVIGLANRSAPR